jgi:signal transduction histidine kinase
MLRARLFLNWIPFVAVLIGLGVYAMWSFTRLLNHVDVTVRQNYQTATVVHDLEEKRKLIDGDLLPAAKAQKITDFYAFNAHCKQFESDLAVLLENIRLLEKTNYVSQLQNNYRKVRDAGLAMSRAEEQDQKTIYAGEVVPRLSAMQGLLRDIGELSNKNMLATGGTIQEITGKIRSTIIVSLIVVFAISLLASWRFGRSVLLPIKSLIQATREIGKGNLDQTLPIVSHDELGELAVAFNKMALELNLYRRSSAEKIMRLHRTMNSAISSFPDPIFVLDRAGHIDLKNPAAEALLERLNLKNVLPSELPQIAGEVLRTGNDFLPHSFTEVLPLRVNGEERAFLPRILTMRGLTQEPIGVAVVLHDVTRFRLLDDAKTNLVATVSHELKTPLTSVRMALHMLVERSFGPLTGRQITLVETARTDAERLLRILNDLLDLTRLEAGKSGLHQEPVAPGILVQAVFEEAKFGVTEKQLQFTTNIEPGLPSVSVDRQRIGHVFHNFIRNAIRHSPAGGRIELRAARTSDGGVQFSVVDQGPGVPEEFKQRIFDRFYRVPGQTKAGAGLGLSIAREIVVAHGGRIGVYSDAGKGSEFYFVLASAEEHELEKSAA